MIARPRYNANARTPLPLRPPRWSIHLTPLLCGLSLLIFLLAMGMGVRSYFDHYEISRHIPLIEPEGTFLAWRDLIQVENGSLQFYRMRARNVPLQMARSGPWQFDRFEAQSELRNRVWGLSFHFDSIPSGSFIAMPLWLFGLFAIPPLLWVRRWRRKRGRGFAVEVKKAAEASA